MNAYRPCHRGLLAISHNFFYVPKVGHHWSPTRHQYLRLVGPLVRPRLARFLGSYPQSDVHGKPHDEVGSFRQIQFPNTWKGRRAEREAHELWASYWRIIPHIDKPLSFKINDGNQSDSSRFSSISREGIIFAKGDSQAERYWRLSHPISLTTRLRWFGFGIRRIAWSDLPSTFKQWLYSIPSKHLAFRQWLYGGPSLSLSSKLMWLISGPNKHPWKRRSPWVRWSVAWLGIFLTTTTLVVASELEPAPLTERLRFVPASARVRLDQITAAERDQAEAILLGQIKKLRTPDIYEKARLGSVFDRLLLACGLKNTRWRLFIVDDPDCPNACVSFAGHVTVWTGLLNAMVKNEQLAAVLSHELSHILMEHPAEAVSINVLDNLLKLSLLPMFIGGFFAPRLILTALTTYTSCRLLSLYASRIREGEADYAAMLLMANAGFDPASTILAWQNLVNFKNSAGARMRQAPLFLSTHPTWASRIANSKENLAAAQSLQCKNRAAGTRFQDASNNDSELQKKWRKFVDQTPSPGRRGREGSGTRFAKP